MAHPLGERIEMVCPICGTAYLANPTRLKWGKQTTCSRKCSYEYRHRNSNGVECICLCCGKTFKEPVSRMKEAKGRGKYCSRECRDQHRTGSNHPQFISGISTYKRGSNWQSTRRSILRRDNYTCQHCFVTKEEVGGKWHFHVHHIKPYRLFSNYEDANQESNLITLCDKCHRKIEAQIQQEM